MHSDILKPIVALVAWTLVMMVWMLARRLPAMKKAGIRLGTLVGTSAADGERALAGPAQWPVHNYMHLMEQPTIFYASALVLAVAGAGNGANAWIAWGYVLLRIAHSLVQVTINKVSIRFALFLLSSLFLVAQTLHAAMAVF